MSAKTRSAPTICTHSATASTTIARKSTEQSRSDTPFASDNSGSRLANSNGREMTASIPTDDAEPQEQPHGPDVDGKNIAKQQRGCLSCLGREEVQEQQSKSER